MNEFDCYGELNVNATSLFTWALEQVKQQQEWYTYFGFQSFPLRVDKVFELCPELQLVNDAAEIMSFGITKMQANDYYQLHTDNVRGVTINMLLAQQDSVCAFVNEQDKQTIRLDYKIGTLYLFNTQVPHTVLNFTGERLLFSTEFKDPKQLLPYRHLKKLLSKVELL